MYITLRWDAPCPSTGAEPLRGRVLPAKLRCAKLHGMDQKSESPTAKLGDRCPRCGKGTLVPSSSGVNLLCQACNRTVLLRQGRKPDDRPDVPEKGHTGGRAKEKR